MQLAHISCNDFRHFLRIRGERLGLLNVYRNPGINQPTLRIRNSIMAYLVHCIDKYLSISPSETADHISCAAVREDCLDKGYEFTRWDCAADQVLQGSFTRVGNRR